MASTQNKLKEFSGKWLNRFFNKYLVFKSWLAITFFVLAFALFNFVLRMGGDLGRITIVIYGVIVLGLCKYLIIEYVLKTVRLQQENSRVYSTILSINTILGLVLPLIYINIVLAVVMRTLHFMTYYGTFFCKIRLSIVNFYYNIHLYEQLNTIIFWIIIFSMILFLFGGLIEKKEK